MSITMGTRTNIRKQIGRILQRIQFLNVLLFHAEMECQYELALMWAEKIYKYRLDVVALQRLL